MPTVAVFDLLAKNSRLLLANRLRFWGYRYGTTAERLDASVL